MEDYNSTFKPLNSLRRSPQTPLRHTRNSHRQGFFELQQPMTLNAVRKKRTDNPNQTRYANDDMDQDAEAQPSQSSKDKEGGVSSDGQEDEFYREHNDQAQDNNIINLDNLPNLNRNSSHPNCLFESRHNHSGNKSSNQQLPKVFKRMSLNQQYSPPGENFQYDNPSRVESQQQSQQGVKTTQENANNPQNHQQGFSRSNPQNNKPTQQSKSAVFDAFEGLSKRPNNNNSQNSSGRPLWAQPKFSQDTFKQDYGPKPSRNTFQQNINVNQAQSNEVCQGNVPYQQSQVRNQNNQFQTRSKPENFYDDYAQGQKNGGNQEPKQNQATQHVFLK